VARWFAAEGARVICAARAKEDLEKVVTELPGSGHVALAFDSSNENEVESASAQLKSEKRVIDAAALCAGQHSIRPLQLLKACHIDELLAANLRSTLLCTKMVMKIAPREGAWIVWVSSAAAMIGNAGEAAYAASKGALLSACRSLAAELASRKIRINVVAPGIVETPMSDRWLSQLSPEQKEAVRSRHLLGFGKPEDVAAGIAFLASDEAHWITGVCLTIDGGLTCH
jgi:NAD(P)-dependent dehydrogenase (short-subunit alcohol dehydrogenase family)